MSHLQEIATRLQVFLESLKNSESREFSDVITLIEREVSYELATGELTDFTPNQMERLLQRLRERNTLLMTEALDDFILRLQAIAQYSYTTESAGLQSVIAAITGKAIKDAVLWSSVVDRPLSATGDLLMPWLDRMTNQEVLAVESLLRKGYAEGWTNTQLTRALRGTRASKYTDGLLIKLGRQNSTIVRTAVQHTNEVARQAVWEANKDVVVGYRWVSTLDRRTSEKCRALDGQTFEVGKGPLPPIHPNCRSTTVAVVHSDYDFLDDGATRSALNGPVPADMTYYGWLKDQPADFQDAVLGPSRAELLRDGGLTVEEFTRLQLNNLFQPRTLEEMRKLAPLAFQRAGI